MRLVYCRHNDIYRMAPFSSKIVDYLTIKSPPTKKLFTREPHNFKFYPEPTINVSAPDCGPSGQVGNLNAISDQSSPAALFPTLKWHHDNPEEVKEYLLIVEDINSKRWTWFADAPTPALRGVYYGIQAGTTEVRATDLVKMKKGSLKWITSANRELIGGFKHGDTDGKIWKVPKSSHHNYFQLVALDRPVDTMGLSHHPTRESFNGAVEGKVIGWGEWVGIYEKP